MPLIIDKIEKKGTLFKLTDIDLWDDKTYSDFFMSINFFYDKYGKVKIDRESIQSAQQYKLASPFLSEFLERIDVPFDPKEPDLWNHRRFFMRFHNILRSVHIKIKGKPGLLLPSLVKKELEKPHGKWMKLIYDDEGVPKIIEKIKKVKAELAGASDLEIAPGQKLINAIGKVARVYDMIADSIKVEDIEDLSTMDKINSLQKLSYLYNAMKKTPPKNLNFIKINTKTGSKEELEDALLTFTGDEE